MRTKEKAGDGSTPGRLPAAPQSLPARAGVRSHAPGGPPPAHPDGARFDHSSYALAFLTGQGECQAECVCALRESLPRSDRGKGKGRRGVGGMEGPPDPGSRSCGWTNRQSTFAASREGESEREKEARWRLASPYVLRHAAAYVRQISARPPSGAETAGSREASVAAQPRRKATAPPAGRREFLQSGFPPRGMDLQELSPGILEEATIVH